MKLSNLILLIVVIFAIGCQKSEKPEEIVRIVPGKSLMEQSATGRSPGGNAAHYGLKNLLLQLEFSARKPLH